MEHLGLENGWFPVFRFPLEKNQSIDFHDFRLVNYYNLPR